MISQCVRIPVSPSACRYVSVWLQTATCENILSPFGHGSFWRQVSENPKFHFLSVVKSWESQSPLLLLVLDSLVFDYKLLSWENLLSLLFLLQHVSKAPFVLKNPGETRNCLWRERKFMSDWNLLRNLPPASTCVVDRALKSNYPWNLLRNLPPAATYVVDRALKSNYPIIKICYSLWCQKWGNTK